MHMNQMPGSTQFNAVPKRRAEDIDGLLGAVFQIAGSSSQVLVDAARLTAFADNPDPCIAMAGQVGSQVKMRVGTHWLIANVRAMALDRRNPETIIADIDFLGEGDEEARGAVGAAPDDGAVAVDVVLPLSVCRVEPVTVAVLEIGPGAAVTVVTSVIKLGACTASTCVLRQVTTWPDAPHVQPAPVAET